MMSTKPAGQKVEYTFLGARVQILIMKRAMANGNTCRQVYE